MAKKFRGRVQRGTLDSSLIEGVGTFIYSTSTQRYLFLLRNSKKYAGTWGLGGGGIEAGENLLTSLYRELDEELGYDFSETKVIPIEKFTSDNGHFNYHTFLIAIEPENNLVMNFIFNNCWCFNCIVNYNGVIVENIVNPDSPCLVGLYFIRYFIRGISKGVSVLP